MATFECFAKSGIGAARDENEDHVLLLDQVMNDGERFVARDAVARVLQESGALCAAVADGVGGQPHGRDASRIVLTTLGEKLAGAMAKQKLSAPFLATSLEQSNAAVVAAGEASEGWKGLCTTVSGIVMTCDSGFLFNVGDSRVYRWREGELAQLTRDDAERGMIAERAGMSLSEAVETGSAKLTRCVGIRSLSIDVEADLQHRPGDRFLVCTDGLFTGMDREQLATTLGETRPIEAIGADLYQAAIDGGSRDNISLVIIDCLA